MEIKLTGLAIHLGEEKKHFSDVESFEDKMTEYGLTISSPFWGWGSFHVSEKSSYEMAKAAISECLNNAAFSPEEIDVVMYCSAGTGEEYGLVNQKMGAVLHEMGLVNAQLFGQSFLGCVSVFSAIHMAKQMIESEACNNIMIVTADKIDNGANRFREFGIYSDSASAFVLSSKSENGFRVINTAFGSNYQLMSGNMESKDDHFKHLNSIHEKAYDGLSFDTKSPEKVFITNLYKPLLQINMVRLGYSKEQTYYENIEEVGHCFATDPFVNLQHYRESEANNDGTFVLAAMATGHAGFCIIEGEEESELII